MNIIFLDIDGVLNSQQYAIRFYDLRKSKQTVDVNSWQFIDPDCLERIVRICSETNAKLIISSSWRNYDYVNTINNFNKYESLSQLVPYIIGVTPRSEERVRGKEINYILDNWKLCTDDGYISKFYREFDITDYVILDDDSDMLPKQMDHFIQTDWTIGITEYQTGEIIKRFTKIEK
jgi:hypothetical protein